MKDEETGEGWLEHWIVVGKVSEAAQKAIELVDGTVEDMYSHNCHAKAVCVLFDDPPDDDVGYDIRQDEDIIQLDIYSADEHVQLVIYSIHPNPDLVQSDITGLHMITLEEYYKQDEERVARES